MRSSPDNCSQREVDLSVVCPLTTAEALARAVAVAPDVEAVVTARRRVSYAALEHDVSSIRK